MVNDNSTLVIRDFYSKNYIPALPQTHTVDFFHALILNVVSRHEDLTQLEIKQLSLASAVETPLGEVRD